MGINDMEQPVAKPAYDVDKVSRIVFERGPYRTLREYRDVKAQLIKEDIASQLINN